jgi:hypothetical protein
MAEATDSRLRTGFRTPGAAKAGCVLALLLFARVAIASNDQGPALRTAAAEVPPAAAERPAPEKLSAASPKISYVDGQLRIDALDCTLAEVLTKVAALTGVNIDVPAGANAERMPIVELGPGPARQVLASLLSDSSFDYLIQASAADPDKIQAVLLMPRDKKGSGTNATEVAARAPRSPYARGAAPPAKPDEAPAPDNPAPSQPEVAVAESASLSPPPAPEQPAPPPPVQPDAQFPLLQPDTSNPAKPGALTPPPTMSPQLINQQLQQMYQQRLQMTQQDHYTGTQPLPPIPGTK